MVYTGPSSVWVLVDNLFSSEKLLRNCYLVLVASCVVLVVSSIGYPSSSHLILNKAPSGPALHIAGGMSSNFDKSTSP